MLNQNRNILTTEVIVCTGAFASVVLLKYLLIRTEKQSSPIRSHGKDEKRNQIEAEDPKDDPDLVTSRNMVEENSKENFASSPVCDLLRTTSSQVIGLSNSGNSCYINSLLQALSCIREFVDWLEHSSQFICLPQRNNLLLLNHSQLLSTSEVPYLRRPPFSFQESRSWSFFHSLRKVMNVLNLRDGFHGETYTATGLIRVMFDGMGRRFQHYQQDPDELFLFMMNLLTGATARQDGSILSFRQQPFRTNQAVISAAGIHAEQMVCPSLEKPWLCIPLQGLFHQDLYCVVCKSYRAQPLEVFYSLSLNLPTVTRQHSLEDLLHSYFIPADLDSVECPRCSELRTKVLRPHLKRISVAKLPRILCIHIRRAVWGIDDSWKRSDKVSFPSILSMRHYSWLHHLGGSQESSPMDKGLFRVKGSRLPHNDGIYSLKSIVVHVGASSNNGHIVTYRKGPVDSPKSESWYFTSDHLVRSASWSEVEASNPYMLFYELTRAG